MPRRWQRLTWEPWERVRMWQLKVPSHPSAQRRPDDTEQGPVICQDHHEKYPTESVFALSTTHLVCRWLQACFYPVYGILLSPVIAAAAMALFFRQRHCECVASESVGSREITLSGLL